MSHASAIGRIKAAVEDALLEEGVDSFDVHKAQQAVVEAVKPFLVPSPTTAEELRTRIKTEHLDRDVSVLVCAAGFDVRIRTSAVSDYLIQRQTVAECWGAYVALGRKAVAEAAK